jgi:Flp pilus assembly protein protease CpaA
MKNYIVTLLLSMLIVLAGLSLRNSTVKAATPQANLTTPLVTANPGRAFAPAIAMGPGPVPCPPTCTN